MKPGDRVFISNPKHPWHGQCGEVIAFETYGLGFTGWRIKLDGSRGEAYVNPDEVMAGRARVDSIRIFTRRPKRGKW